MNFVFHPDAEAEFQHAINYYEEAEPGLGYDFALEVHEAIQRAITLPTAWPQIVDEIRRTLVRRFPYGVLYSVERESIFIIAIMNLHRHPDYWQLRR